jgi:hypothetical protein
VFLRQPTFTCLSMLTAEDLAEIDSVAPTGPQPARAIRPDKCAASTCENF